MKEHPEDICHCGDYRKEHPDNGACALNGLGHAIPRPEGDCLRFRWALSYSGFWMADRTEEEQLAYEP